MTAPVDEMYCQGVDLASIATIKGGAKAHVLGGERTATFPPVEMHRRSDAASAPAKAPVCCRVGGKKVGSERWWWCVCVCERERERGREGGKGRQGKALLACTV